MSESFLFSIIIVTGLIVEVVLMLFFICKVLNKKSEPE